MVDFVEKFEWIRAVALDARFRSRSVVAIAFYLADRFNEAKGGKAWPGLGTIARAARVSPKNAKDAVRELERLGYVRIERDATYMLEHRKADSNWYYPIWEKGVFDDPYREKERKVKKDQKGEKEREGAVGKDSHLPPEKDPERGSSKTPESTLGDTTSLDKTYATPPSRAGDALRAEGGLSALELVILFVSTRDHIWKLDDHYESVDWIALENQARPYVDAGLEFDTADVALFRWMEREADEGLDPPSSLDDYADHLLRQAQLDREARQPGGWHHRHLQQLRPLWSDRLKAFAADPNSWNETEWGDPPDVYGCGLPPELVAEFGIDQEGRPRLDAA